MHLTDAQNITEPFDYAFITVKSYDTEWATHFVKRYVKDDGAFVSIQNCWNDPTIANIVGEDRQLGLHRLSHRGGLWEPAHVNRGGAPGRDHGHTVFRIGEYTGAVTPRSEALAAKLDHIDAAYATDNLPGERWAKLCQNGMGNAISAMSQLGSQEMAGDARIRRIRINLAKEGAQVGLAQGLRVVEINGTPAEFWADADTGDVFEELDGKLSQAGGRVNWLASMAQDVHKGRKSEIDFMNGLICEKGRRPGLRPRTTTPLSRPCGWWTTRPSRQDPKTSTVSSARWKANPPDSPSLPRPAPRMRLYITVEPAGLMMHTVQSWFSIRPDPAPEDQQVRDYLSEHELEPATTGSPKSTGSRAASARSCSSAAATSGATSRTSASSSGGWWRMNSSPPRSTGTSLTAG